MLTVKTPPVAVSAGGQVPTPDTRALRREAHGLIEISFDVVKGRYNEGYSDERIAKESGMPVAWVVKRREDEFGPLKEPDELATVRSQLNIASKFVADIQKHLDEIVKANGWKT